MAAVAPRWEWRTFGSHFGAAESFFADLEADVIQESDELYLLSHGEANVKIRDELVDIKVLNDVNAAGLEQWTPVMKAAFPLASPDLAMLYEALGLSAIIDEYRRPDPGSTVRGVGYCRTGDPSDSRAQAEDAPHGRWLHGGDHRSGRRREVDAHDCDRVRGSRCGGRRGRIGRSPGIRKHQLFPGSPGDHRRHPEPLCRHRCRDQLGQVPSRRTCRRWDLASRRRSGRGHPSWRGPGRRWVDLVPSAGTGPPRRSTGCSRKRRNKA